MELHLNDEEIAGLERALSTDASLATRVALAWHMRERDSRRALALADECDASWRQSAVTPLEPLRQRQEAYLSLTRAEALTWLFDIDSAAGHFQRARQYFEAHQDVIGLGDAALTDAGLGIARGDSQRYERAFAEAVAQYQRSHDRVRLAIGQAWSAYIGAYADPERALAAAQRVRDQWNEPLPIAASAVLSAAEAAANFWRDPTKSAAMALRAREFAVRVGLVRLATMASSNAGWVLECLGDFDAALECIEWSVLRARQAEWPMVTASTEVRLGSVLRELGQLERSHDILTAAVARFEALPGGTHKAIALAALGRTLLQQGRTSEAVALFEASVRMCREARSTDNLVDGVIQLARAQSVAGRPDAALAAVAEAWSLIEEFGFAERTVAVHQALADIHRAHRLPPPPGMQVANARLHHLEQALLTGRAVAGWNASASLLMALADAWFQAGDAAQAYAYAKEAISTERSDSVKKAANRSMLMQVRHETAQALADAEHHRTLAATLSQQSQTLEQLGHIGQEITANLDQAGVFAALARHLGEMTDAPHLAIWLMDEDGRHVSLRHGSEDGQPITLRSLDIDTPHSRIAACMRTRRELLIDIADAEGQLLIPGTRAMQTAYFGPLVVAERVLGAISIQSAQPNAYGERELLIFRTLCAYSAIALDNTRAYQQLQDARRQLEDASLTDPLTGLRNRRYLAAHADADATLAIRQHEHALREGRAARDADLIFLLVDIDHFKSVNDQHGHAAGDAVLMQMRARLEPVFRASDHLVRWGGEEFLIVARATARERAEELAERVCDAVRAEPFALADGRSLAGTCSLGFACFPFDVRKPRTATWQEVVDLADISLYTAKRSGRNTWVGVHAGEVSWAVRDIKRDAAEASRQRAVRFSCPYKQIVRTSPMQ